MAQVPGSMGTAASLALRLAQIVFAVASLFFMRRDLGFYNFSAFCFLALVMVLVILWSMILALLDIYSVSVHSPPPLPGRLAFVIVGDWVLSFLSLGASCATPSAAAYLLSPSGAAFSPQKHCSGCWFSAAMAMLAWLMIFASALLNIWLLPKLQF